MDPNLPILWMICRPWHRGRSAAPEVTSRDSIRVL